MIRMSRLVSLLLLTGILTIAKPANADEPIQNPQEIQKNFQVALAKSISKLRDLEKSKKYKLKSINDSIRLTLEAVDLLMQRRHYAKSESLLLESLAAYPENIIARLVLADVFESQGKQQEANQTYGQFLKEGEKANQLSNDSTDFETRGAFSSYVRKKLATQQIFPPKPRGYGFLPLSLRLQTGEKSWLLSFVAAGIPVLMIFISIIFVLRKILNLYEPRVSVFDKLIFGIFITFFSAYVLWMLHLFLNIPPIAEPVEYEIVSVLFLGLALTIGKLVRERHLKEERLRSDPTLKQCPHCKQFVQKLNVICSNCNKEIPD